MWYHPLDEGCDIEVFHKSSVMAGDCDVQLCFETTCKRFQWRTKWTYVCTHNSKHSEVLRNDSENWIKPKDNWSRNQKDLQSSQCLISFHKFSVDKNLPENNIKIPEKEWQLKWRGDITIVATGISAEMTTAVSVVGKWQCCYEYCHHITAVASDKDSFVKMLWFCDRCCCG